MRCTLSFMPVWEELTPSLTLGYLKGALLHENIECVALSFASRFKPILKGSLGDQESQDVIIAHPSMLADWKNDILSTNPDVIGFSVLISNFRVTEAVVALLRKEAPRIPIVVGGPCFSCEQMHNIWAALRFADYVVEGEGETILPRIVRSLEQGEDVRILKQIWFLGDDGNPQYSGPAPLEHLDTKPFPNFDGIDLTQFPIPRCLPMFFSRGCILNCVFCTNKWTNKTHRTRTARNVFKELQRNISTYHIESYYFNDDSFMSRVSLKEIETYCDMVISAGLAIPWSVYASRIEPLLTPSCVAKLREAGLYQIVLGVESFSSAVQKDMGKSANYELTDRVIRMFVDVGVATRIFLIYGYPTETDEDFEITCCWLEENGHLLSSIWVNSFVLNDVYQAARPNRAHFESPNPWVEGGRPWAWSSEHSTLENRKERFFRLLKIGQRMRLRNPATTYSIGDPYMVKYFTEWSPSDLQYLQERWARLEGR